MRNDLLIFELQLLLLALTPGFNEAITFKFTNFVCENFNKSWLEIYECRLRAVSRSQINLNFNATLLHPIRDFEMDYQFFKKANGYKPWLYKGKINVCRFLKKPYNPLIILIYNLFSDFSNINHSCPYVGTVYVKGFHLRINKMPHAIPTGDYLLKMTFFFENTTQCITFFYFQFKEDL